ncbi:MAG: PLP-dependent aminotransferase family protein [Fusobacteriaceae bacterium]|jgi:DNA-binding transcriptional MocR family regulator|nr:PLP-dependent aminotransferase family protein [Fusobacteriaceae bacterium]
MEISSEKSGKHPPCEQLYERLKEELIRKKMPGGAKFYSVRQIVRKYGVNINTSLKAFHRLERDGYIFSVEGKGSFVKEAADFHIHKETVPILETFGNGQQAEKYAYNFANGTPSSCLFPVEAYRELSDRAIRESGRRLFEYQNIQGLQSLRAVFADFLEKQDIFVTADDIVVTSGTQHALSIILKAFGSQPPKTVVLSAPTYLNALNFFHEISHIKTMELQPDGWDMEAFEKFLQKDKIHFAYITVNFQNPTGILWSLEKRQKLLDLARFYDFYIIEDDCFSDFYYTGAPVPSLKSLDQWDKERVIYIKTYSKTFMPAISLAPMVFPKPFRDKFILSKYGLDPNTSGLNQKILEYYISEDYQEKHLKKCREILSRRYHKMLSLVEKLPNAQLPHIPQGGFFFWIRLADRVKPEDFLRKCTESGVLILPGGVFYHDGRDSSFVRLSFVSSGLKEIEGGMDILHDILSAFR